MVLYLPISFTCQVKFGCLSLIMLTCPINVGRLCFWQCRYIIFSSAVNVCLALVLPSPLGSVDYFIRLVGFNNFNLAPLLSTISLCTITHCFGYYISVCACLSLCTSVCVLLLYYTSNWTISRSVVVGRAAVAK